jgi:hypothetical protein
VRRFIKWTGRSFPASGFAGKERVTWVNGARDEHNTSVAYLKRNTGQWYQDKGTGGQVLIADPELIAALEQAINA